MSYRVLRGLYRVPIIGLIKGDMGSLDYSSNGFLAPASVFGALIWEWNI